MWKVTWLCFLAVAVSAEGKIILLTGREHIDDDEDNIGGCNHEIQYADNSESQPQKKRSKVMQKDKKESVEIETLSVRTLLIVSESC